MDVLEKLKPLCSADRPDATSPFAVNFDGRKWACATDHHALAMVPYDGELRRDGPPVSRVLPVPPVTATVTFTALRDWAGEMGPETVTCPKCKGTPPPKCAECKGEGVVDAADCECPSCSGDHTCPTCRGKSGGCRECNSAGRIKTPPRAGLVGSIVIDRELVARALVCAPQEGVAEFSDAMTDRSPIYLRAPDWIAVIMPLRSVPAKDLPRLALNGITAQAG